MKTFLRNAAFALLGSTALAVASPASAAPHDHWGGHWGGGHWGHFAGHPGHFAFHHDFAHFSPAEHAAWTHGHWWHGWHGGHVGWWWWAGGGWFWYGAPIYPYPSYYVQPYDYDYGYDGPNDDGGDYGPGPGGPGPGGPGPGYGGPGPNGGGYWYHCSSPEGYYPYVQSCRNGWTPVPPHPADAYPGGPGGPAGHDVPPGHDERADRGPNQLQGHDGGYRDDDDDDNGPPPPSH